MECNIIYTSKDGNKFNSKDECEEYEKYYEFFHSYLDKVLPHRDGLFNFFSYYFNSDLTVDEFTTHDDPMSGRPPLRNSRNIGYIRKLIDEYQYKLDEILNKELEKTQERINNIKKNMKLLKDVK
jgi:hypothetical protein